MSCTARRPLLALIMVVLLVLAPVAARAENPSTMPFDLRPGTIGTDVEIPNPLRGQYAWYGQDPTPELSGPDLYERVFWSDLESADQTFTTWPIGEGLRRAANRGGTYAFRVMAVCQACSSTKSTLPPHLDSATGTWTATLEKGGQVRLPDWNSETFLSEWEELMAHLGTRYDGNPRLGYIDVGGYGNWGEWHAFPFEQSYPGPQGQRDVSLASSLRMVRAVEKSFPRTTIVLNTTGARNSRADGTALPVGKSSYEWSNRLRQDVLALDDRIGLRNDCLGAGLSQEHAVRGLAEASRYGQAVGGRDPLQRWRTAPFVTEWCGNNKPPTDFNRNGVFEDGEYDDYNGNGMIETWEKGSGGHFWNGLEQVEGWHVSLLSSGNYTGPLSSFPAQDRADFRRANPWSGYRYQIERARGEIRLGGQSTVTTTWRNLNVAPAYRDWDVYVELRRPTGEVVAYARAELDLAEVLPGRAYEVTTTVDTRSVGSGEYELAVLVLDPTGTLPHMRLANSGTATDGSLVIGRARLG